MPGRYYVEKTRTRSGIRYLPMTDEVYESLRTIIRNRPDLANAGMDVKNLQYLMGLSDVGVTLNIYTHSSYDHAADQLLKLVGKAPESTPVTTPISTPFFQDHISENISRIPNNR